MYKDVLRSIEGVEIFPIIALLIFFTFFIGVIVWSIRMDGDRLRAMSLLPLEGDDPKDATPRSEGEGHE